MMLLLRHLHSAREWNHPLQNANTDCHWFVCIFGNMCARACTHGTHAVPWNLRTFSTIRIIPLPRLSFMIFVTRGWLRGDSTKRCGCICVYTCKPANVIHLCKLHRLRRLQDKYPRGFNYVSLVFPTTYIAGANFIRSSVNLGISLGGPKTWHQEPAAFFSEFPEWNNYTGRLLITKNTRVVSIPTRYYSSVRTKRLLVLPYTGLTSRRI